MFKVLVPVFCLLAWQAQAASVTNNLSVKIGPAVLPLTVVFTPPAPTILCAAPAGTLIDTLSVTGGDGNAVTYSIPTTFNDFVISGNMLVVGPAGIASADCGQTWVVSVTATQP